jgi:hypothetical protein
MLDGGTLYILNGEIGIGTIEKKLDLPAWRGEGENCRPQIYADERG